MILPGMLNPVDTLRGNPCTHAGTHTEADRQMIKRKTDRQIQTICKGLANTSLRILWFYFSERHSTRGVCPFCYSC